MNQHVGLNFQRAVSQQTGVDGGLPNMVDVVHLAKRAGDGNAFARRALVYRPSFVTGTAC